MMDTQILRKPAAGEVWQHRNGAYYHVVAVANEDHKHEDHPVDVVYRSMRQDNGQPSHWWTRPLATWHEKMTFVSELSPAVPSVGRLTDVNYMIGSHVEARVSYRIDEILNLPQVGDKVRLYLAPRSSEKSLAEVDADIAFAVGVAPVDECATNRSGHVFRRCGPERATRCVYCGEEG